MQSSAASSFAVSARRRRSPTGTRRAFRPQFDEVGDLHRRQPYVPPLFSPGVRKRAAAPPTNGRGRAAARQQEVAVAEHRQPGDVARALEGPPRPAPVILRGFNAVSSASPNCTLPDVAQVSPMYTHSGVDFSAPLGPMTACTVPGATEEKPRHEVHFQRTDASRPDFEASIPSGWYAAAMSRPP